MPPLNTPLFIGNTAEIYYARALRGVWRRLGRRTSTEPISPRNRFLVVPRPDESEYPDDDHEISSKTAVAFRRLPHACIFSFYSFTFFHLFRLHNRSDVQRRRRQFPVADCARFRALNAPDRNVPIGV